MCGREFSWGSDGVGKGTTCGGESALGAGSVDDMLFKARRSDVVEPRWADRGGGDGRGVGDEEAADSANPLRVAKR